MEMLIMFLFQSCLCSSFPILSTRGRGNNIYKFPMFKELYLSKICFIYTLTIINLWIYKLIYPLVNSHITMENHTMLSLGKSTISMAIFNSKLLVYQRVMCSSAFFIMTSWNPTFYMLGPRLLIVPPSPGRPPLHPQLGMIYSWFTMVRKQGFKVLTIFSTFKVY